MFKHKELLFIPSFSMFGCMKIFGKAFSSLLLLLALLSPFTASAQLLLRLHEPFGWPPDATRFRDLPHYKNGQFQNLQETSSSLDFSERLSVIKRYLNPQVEKVPSRYYRFSEQPLAQKDTTGLQLNWLGHAAVLIKSGNRYLLTDPALIGRASPFSFVGPERFFPSPIAPADLPELEAVIISHDHYDHLSYQTLKAIHHKVKQFFVPLGVGASLRRWGIPEEKIIEMDWWQEHKGEGLSITAAPAQHFSGRYMQRNNTLWASWAINFDGHRIYFGGDSGFFEGYREIGQKLGPFDISFMPIGAYDKAWQAIHLNPEEALQAHELLQGGVFLPIHWGTFNLAPHSWYDPMERLAPQAKEADIRLLTPRPGQWVTPASPTNPFWWQEYRQTQ